MSGSIKHIMARSAAVEALCLWASVSTPVDLIFNSTVAELDDADRGLAKTLVYGVLRQRDYLDWIIGQFSKHPLAKMKTRTLMTLRVGVYQLFFLTRIPESAAVNTTVNTLKAAGQPAWLIGFVNGLLRAIVRAKASLPRPEDALSNNSPILNHPPWLVDRWHRRYGAEKTRAICQLNNTEPDLTLRTNIRRNSRASLLALLQKCGITACEGRFSPAALIIDKFPGSVAALPGYEEGFFQVQDEAAQLASLLFGPLASGCRILDACAGLGGKTCHLAETAPPGAIITAIEPDEKRFSLLNENLRRLGLDDYVVSLRTDLARFASSAPLPFHAILVDAPCSGTGVIRRQPDIRWNRHPEDLPANRERQLRLLETAATLLAPGGTLVYATCSMEPEENEEVIVSFLQQHPRLTIRNARESLPEKAHILVDTNGFFRSNPTDGLDGFFAAAMA